MRAPATAILRVSFTTQDYLFYSRAKNIDRARVITIFREEGSHSAFESTTSDLMGFHCIHAT